MRTRAALTVKCADAHTKTSLASILAPDNEGTPHGLELSVGGGGRELEFAAESESLSTTISTTLALLRDIALFQEIWLLSQA